MAITKTGAKALKYYNPKYLIVTPFEGTAKGSTIYQVENVVRDTTQITQNDNEETRIDSEFTSEPIINNISTGSYTFSTEIADLQGDLVKALAGFDVDSVSNKVYAPSGYKEVFAEIALVFETGGQLVAAIMPKVQLNSKLLIESLNSSVGRITIAGIGYNLDVTDGANHHVSPFYLDPKYTLPE